MTEKEKKFLSDISNSIELIETFTKDLRSFADYQQDLKTKGAVSGFTFNQTVRLGNS